MTVTVPAPMARKLTGDFGDVPLSEPDLEWIAGNEGRKRKGRLSTVLRVLRGPSVAIPGAVFLLVVLACFLGPILFGLPSPVEGSLGDTLKPPGTSGHPLGTNELGNDELSRLLHGGQVSIIVGIVSTALSLAIGAILGMSACFFGGIYEKIVMRVFDTLLAFPSLILAMTIADYLGPSLRNTILAISIFGVSRFGRLAWSRTLTIRNRDFVVAPRSDGARSGWILFRHILPNVIPPLLGIAMFHVGSAIMIEAGLSYLGLGVAQPNPTWGNMISTGQQFINNAPRLIVIPCLALLVTVLSLNLLADALQNNHGGRR